MFPLREDELTWEVVGEWNSENYDSEYNVCWKHFEPNGKARRMRHIYFLKGMELFVCGLEMAPEPREFTYKQLIPLGSVLGQTQLIIDRLPPSFWTRATPRVCVEGEQFFQTHPAGARWAFMLRYPQTRNFFHWRDAIALSDQIKKRLIHNASMNCE